MGNKKFLMCVLFLTLLGMSSLINAQENRYQLRNDTLRINLPECEGKTNLINGFYALKGITISNYYKILDSLSLHINADKRPDMILVLSPVSQEKLTALPCEAEFGKRLLVTLLSSKNGKYSIGIINDEAVLNTSEYTVNPYKGMVKTKDGFSMDVEFGTIIYCKYRFYFTCKSANFFLTKAEYDCFNKGNPGKAEKKSKRYANNKYNLKDIRISEFIDVPNLASLK
jgi:hypothetical protein